MVLINRIYTRTGDAGSTRLASGAEVSKADLRVAAYGDVDEANACLGLVRLHTSGTDLDPLLARLQNELFDLGADLATPPGPAEDRALRILDSQVERLEREIDALNEGLGELTSFVLPGGSPAAAYLHLARTVARRAERSAVALAGTAAITIGAFTLSGTDTGDVTYVVTNIAKSEPIDGIITYTVSAQRYKTQS